MPDFADLCSKLDDCRYRIAFLQDAFSQNAPRSGQPIFEMTQDGQTGLYAILQDIKEDVRAAEDMADAIINKPAKLG